MLEFSPPGSRKPDSASGLVEVALNEGQVEEREVKHFKEGIAGGGFAVDHVDGVGEKLPIWLGQGGRRSWSHPRCDRPFHRFAPGPGR